MRVAIVGGGAAGTFVGATLAAGGLDVVIVRRSGSADLQRTSIALDGPGPESRHADLAVAGSPDALTSPPDVVILAVKMPDLPGAIETISIWPSVPVLAACNGVGADDMLLDRRTSGIIAGSLTAAVMLDPAAATVHRLSRGGIGLAPVRDVAGLPDDTAGPSPSALPAPSVDGTIGRLVTGFVAGGLRARRLDDAAAMRWSKLLANLLGNATSAILDMDPADVYRDRALFDVERRQLREALAVMRGLNLRPIALPGADVRLLTLAARLPAALVRPVMLRVVGGGRGGKSPSLRLHLQDGGGPSEVAWLNGTVSRAAMSLGRRAPVNARLAELVEACSGDPERRAWFRGRPDRVIAELPGS